MTVLQMACQCLPLIEAVDEGWMTIEEQRERSKRTVKILLEHAARYSECDPSTNLYLDVNAKADPGGQTAFEIAVLAGRVDLVELFINYSDIEDCLLNLNLRDHPGLCFFLLSESLTPIIDAETWVQYGQLTHLQLKLK